jgi:hypothetical protein
MGAAGVEITSSVIRCPSLNPLTGAVQWKSAPELMRVCDFQGADTEWRHCAVAQCKMIVSIQTGNFRKVSRFSGLTRLVVWNKFL